MLCMRQLGEIGQLNAADTVIVFEEELPYRYSEVYTMIVLE